MLERRGTAAGIGPSPPHRLRHSFAHAWLAGGREETDLIRLAGWSSRQMVGRYAARSAQDVPAMRTDASALAIGCERRPARPYVLRRPTGRLATSSGRFSPEGNGGATSWDERTVIPPTIALKSDPSFALGRQKAGSWTTQGAPRQG